MDSNSLTTLLTVLLISSVIILFILIIVFLVLTFAKQKKEKEKEQKLEGNTAKVPTTSSKIVQTKAYTTANVQDFMKFDEIKDNLIVQEKGKRYVMVIQCQGINYDLMSAIEKVSVEQGFVQFLNTLTRPIQLYVQARKVNLEESLENYRKRLKDIESRYKRVNFEYQQALKDGTDRKQLETMKYEYIKQKNLYEYTKDIINNTEKMSLNKNILTKNYYIVLSYMPENTDEMYQKEELIDMAFSELYTNAQSLLRVLSVTGVTGKVLNSVELADLLYVAYNRDASEVLGVDKAIRSGYDSLYTTAPDVVEKKIKELDKIIKEQALDMANKAIEEATLDTKRKRELEAKERDIQELVREMAKSMIYENQEYLSKEITEEAVEKIDKNTPEEKKTSRRTKKGVN